MDLVGIDSNPVPNGAVAGTIRTADGVSLRFARWKPTGRRSQGTVCLMQGRAEQIEKYFEVISELRRRGFAVATFDWRGQGGSERRLRDPRRGHVDSFSEYDRDLDCFLQEVVLPDCPPPHYALAHSTGGLICLRAAQSGRARFTRIVVLAPLAGLGPMRLSQENAHRLAGLLTAFGFGELYVPGGKGTSIEDIPFEGNPLTGDANRFARNVEIVTSAPQLAIGPPTIGWLYAACQAMQEAADPDFGPAIKVPTLVVTAAIDRIVSVRAIETLSGELRAGAQVVIAGSEHEVLMERDFIRQQFWAAFDAFVPGTRLVGNRTEVFA
jgi:lysophospholipase